VTDPPNALHWLLGCLVLNADWGWQVAWLVLFALGLVFSWAAVRQGAREMFMPGVA
jgi:hypothetical protein